MQTSTNPSLGRVEAIDIFRGLALAAMLLVNNPGSWGAVYAPLLHADWHGLTPTDLVFPFFLFAVGASMACSFRQRVLNNNVQWLAVIRRAILLFAIGLLLHAFPFEQAISELRILGVLQRIALCFFIVALVVASSAERFLMPIAVAVLLGYWWVLESVPVGPYALDSNLVRTLDLSILGASHLWQGKGIAFDPEGLLSTIPAAITVLSGYWVSITVFQTSSFQQQRNRLLGIGAVLLILGMLWSQYHPINKSLWTGSFVLATSACACFALALITQCWHVWQIKTGWFALKVYGSNALALYVVAWLFAALLRTVEITVAERTIAIKTYLFQLFATAMPDKLASLLYAILFTLTFYSLAVWLYRRKLFIRL